MPRVGRHRIGDGGEVSLRYSDGEWISAEKNLGREPFRNENPFLFPPPRRNLWDSSDEGSMVNRLGKKLVEAAVGAVYDRAYRQACPPYVS